MNFPGKTAIRLAMVGCLLLAATAQDSRPFGLQSISPHFWDLIDKNAKLETAATGFGFTDRQHRLIDCASVLRAIIEVTPDGKYKILADHYDGKKLNSPNDVIVGPDSALYFTDPTLDLVAGEKQEIPYQGVYRLDGKGNVQLLTKDLTQPNGLAFSPDGKHFYVDDSEKKNIRVYDVASDATLTNGRIFGEEPGEKHEGVPDGIKVDNDGNLFVTGPKGIWVWDAKGNHLGTIIMPEQPANLAWGDKDYRTLYITATTSVYRLETKTQGFVPYLNH
jgi:gluconolactonase